MSKVFRSYKVEVDPNNVHLSNLGKSTVGSTGIKAFGEGSSVGLETVQHSLSEKKEYNIECATVVR